MADSKTGAPGVLAETHAHLLARSAFAIMFFALVGYGVVLPFLLRVPMRPDVRPLFNAALIAALLILLALCGLFFWLKPEQLEATAERVVWVLQQPWVSGGLFLLLVEANILLAYFINAVTPNLRLLIYLGLYWSALVVLVLWIAVRSRMEGWLGRTRSVWSGLGLFLAAALFLGVMWGVSAYVLEASGWLGAARGHFDYRELIFYGGVRDPELSKAYWRELGEVQAQWLPYSYTRIQPVSGQYINVDRNGLRRTVLPEGVPDDAPHMFFFGGSTMWGDGARDAYTIPSHAARLLMEANMPAQVTNYGQVAYVTQQDLILFQTQLAKGNIPDLAIFYGGYNDIISSQMYGMVGLPHGEIKRAQEFLSGRWLDAGRPVLAPPRLGMDEIDFSLVTRGADDDPDTLAEQTAANYLALQNLIRAAAQAHDVDVLFVWQPMLNYKDPLTLEEDQINRQQEADFPGFNALYDAVDQRIRAENQPDTLILSDLFDGTPDKVFIDRVHITEDGNAWVAQALVPVVAALLAGATAGAGI